MSNGPSNDHRTLPTVEATAHQRRRAFWLSLAVIWLFAICFLQFGLLDHLTAPAIERVNDGDHATFFAVHINPYFIFSEDFHLYVVRSKRIMDRGWTDSLLASTPHERPNYSAPIQAALMMLAVTTDGEPVKYSLFIVGVLAIAWSVLYVAAARWLPSGTSTWTPLVAVMVTVLFESIRGLLHPVDEFGQWPVHRGLRISTLAWTSPLLLALVIAAVALLFNRRRTAGRMTFVGAALAILAASDNWAFILGLACAGVVFLTLSIVWIVERRRTSEAAGWTLRAALGLLAAIALSLLVHRVTLSGFEGDVLTRAGFGRAWRNSPLGASHVRWLVRWHRSEGLLLAAIAVAAATYVQIRIAAKNRSARLRVWLGRLTPMRWHLLALAVVPIVATSGTIAVLTCVGMDGYHPMQFIWRFEFLLLFALIVAVVECVMHVGRTWHSLEKNESASNGAGFWRSAPARWQLTLVAMFLAALFVYHNVRIFQFMWKTASREFFLTKDEEHLRDWLRSRAPSLGKYSLATASHELNYLCAYWTNADLMLPEGFPYHSAATDDEIADSMAEVLAVYGATPRSWSNFNLHRHVWDQWSWARSRSLSARHGYMYYLMHRELLAEGFEAEPARPIWPGRTTSYYAEERLWHDAHQVAFKRPLAGIHFADQIAERLCKVAPSEKKDGPTVIIVDEVSRSLGTPDLTGYTREFQHGDLEAWVLTDR